MVNLSSLAVLLGFALSMDLLLKMKPSRITREGTNLNETSEHQFRRCGDFCEFRLCEFNADDDVAIRPSGSRFILFGKPRRASWPWICLPMSSKVIGHVLRTGKVEVRARNGKYMKISRLRTGTGVVPFRRGKVLLPLRINAAEIDVPKSGIALDRALSSDQKQALEGKCLVMPITRFQVLSNSGNLAAIENVGGRRACVALTATTRTPTVRVVLHWHNQDNLDLYLTEPNGNRISTLNQHSDTGGFLVAEERGSCSGRNTFREATETVNWLPSSNPLLGQYSVVAEHSRSCQRGPAEWFLLLIIDEELRVLGSGNHTSSIFAVDIAQFTFVLSS